MYKSSRRYTLSEHECCVMNSVCTHTHRALSTPQKSYVQKVTLVRHLSTWPLVLGPVSHGLPQLRWLMSRSSEKAAVCRVGGRAKVHATISGDALVEGVGDTAVNALEVRVA